eukprot:CAMPEP_0201555446 /NCGR_PEP_ID=MMETSP0173_2-20130828/49035_1 /ASSEMBLY_ACC=CAM_ASM_000268 /TAXON_ID=218659 /ORGANISM="Vexillifera sp., Strain DIVA3 564/2" /LENGTH=83 /DNA_ID=CAMNT_0047967241 /DNA_START=71 /DNA_END=318 /DNA_ORIENTATION=+
MNPYFMKLMPRDVDILITHTPPVSKVDGGSGEETIAQLIERKLIAPSLIVCGHMHSSHGCDNETYESTTIVNAANCTSHAKIG